MLRCISAHDEELNPESEGNAERKEDDYAVLPQSVTPGRVMLYQESFRRKVNEARSMAGLVPRLATEPRVNLKRDLLQQRP